MDPEVLPEQADCLWHRLGMGDFQGGQGALDGDCVDGEARRGVLRHGDVKVFAPAKTLGVDPFVFVLGV